MTRVLALLACLLATGCADRYATNVPLSAETSSPAIGPTGWTP
ncbi:MAG TPA: hypothetical protein VHY76_00640 [Acetobacteraceae bacterium]|nr:hypothetical protein [Acetobacteraceae bacterium]